MKLISLAISISLLTISAMAELKLASPFTDNAVLQRDIPVPIWGTTDAGSSVTIEFAGQTKLTKADAQGKWSVKLGPLEANAQAQTLKVSDSKNHLTITNILVGEVWICSGQSNMQMGHTPDVRPLARKATNIRSFEVKKTVAFTEQDQLEGQWSTEAPSSAVALSFAYHLQQQAKAPIGIVLTCWGSSSLEAWMPRDMIDTVPHFKTMIEEFDANTEAQQQITEILKKAPWTKRDDVFLRRQTNLLYNAMLHPLAPYACRGLVWYQGERNTQSMFGMVKEPWFSRNSGMLKYGDTLNAWIQRIRKEWHNDSMHFLIAMLPGYDAPWISGPKLGMEHPETHSWAWMRESQLKAHELPHTSVSNNIDLGDAKNIHPKDKLPVGQRLALLAARDTLNKKITAQGPTLKNVEPKGDHILVHFDNAEGLKTSDAQSPTGFWIADNSQKWVQAEASIDGTTIKLRSSTLEKPLYVRYAFAGKPSVNLVNAEGLPAYPFRTDHFQPSK
ncbi:sialate O-acetylesterase [Rubritalea spongiae]|uniref:Sialate O-acetylesterase n=1 Tax=Rubritalea spongiae TaxID=430797 RepID=A0ABW5E622_9BACT